MVVAALVGWCRCLAAVVSCCSCYCYRLSAFFFLYYTDQVVGIHIPPTNNLLAAHFLTPRAPKLATSRWKTSWKRFFIEMAYQAKYYMLYPNYNNQTSFATNWLEVSRVSQVSLFPR